MALSGNYSFLEFFYSVAGLLFILFAFSLYFNDFGLFLFVVQLFFALIAVCILAFSAFLAIFFAIFAANIFLAVFLLACIYYFRQFLPYLAAAFIMLAVFF